MDLDTSAVLQGVIQRALAGTADNGADPLDGGSKGPEQMIIEMLGERLGRFLSGSEDQSPRSDEAEVFTRPGHDFSFYDRLSERNCALAAALGACDCWGDDVGCEICGGSGRPGWFLPDRLLFAKYVRPAIHAVRHAQIPPSGSTDGQTQSNGAQP